jgi:hypothetical protein
MCCWRLYHTRVCVCVCVRVCVHVLTARLLTTLISLVISLAFQCWLAGYIATTILNVRINSVPQTIKTYLVEPNSKRTRGELAFGITEKITFRRDASTGSYLKQSHNPPQFQETVNIKFVHSFRVK